jgi:hypothetical protein
LQGTFVSIVIRFIAVLLAALLLPTAADADAYRCKAKNGSILYSDSPCPPGTVASKNIDRLIDACTTPECISQKKLNEEAALQRLEAQKLESERYQERLLKAEELRLRELAVAKEQMALAIMERQMRMMESEAGGYSAYGYPGYWYPGYGYPAYGYPYLPGRGWLRPNPPRNPSSGSRAGPEVPSSATGRR